jgi:hypothetical protein
VMLPCASGGIQDTAMAAAGACNPESPPSSSC